MGSQNQQSNTLDLRSNSKISPYSGHSRRSFHLEKWWKITRRPISGAHISFSPRTTFFSQDMWVLYVCASMYKRIKHYIYIHLKYWLLVTWYRYNQITMPWNGLIIRLNWYGDAQYSRLNSRLTKFILLPLTIVEQTQLLLLGFSCLLL